MNEHTNSIETSLIRLSNDRLPACRNERLPFAYIVFAGCESLLKCSSESECLTQERSNSEHVDLLTRKFAGSQYQRNLSRSVTLQQTSECGAAAAPPLFGGGRRFGRDCGGQHWPAARRGSGRGCSCRQTNCEEALSISDGSFAALAHPIR